MHVKFLALHIYMNQKIRSSHYTVKGKKIEYQNLLFRLFKHNTFI